MNSSKVVLGVLSGITAGALVGILFAPAKGKKTRKRIVSKSKHLADDMKGKFDELYENVTIKYENILQEAKELVDNHDVK